MRYLSFLKNEYFLYFIFYFFSYFLILINYEAVYWDGWALYNHSIDALESQFYQNSGAAGSIIVFIHWLMLKKGVFLYRLLTFLLFFANVYFVNKILKSLEVLDKKDVFFLTLFFAIAPLYTDRILIINFIYNLCLFIFYFAFFLLTKYINKKNFILRIIILGLFFFSFLANSLLVFYFIVLMYLYFKEYGNLKLSFSKLKNYIIKYIDFIALPFIFFVIKILFFKPSGLYAGYNSIDIFNPLVYIGILYTFYTSFIEPINISLSFLSIIWILVVIVIIFCRKIDFLDKKYDKIILLLGMFIFALAVYPYLAVHKIPNLWDTESRHQLLLLLPFSIILYFLIKNFSKKINIYTILIVTFIFSFTAFNIKTYYDFLTDWFYRVSLMENIKNNKLIKQNSTIIFDDTEFLKFLAEKRKISFYEYSGMLKKVFNNDTKLGVSVLKFKGINYYFKYNKYPQYNYLHWKFNKRKIVMVKIEPVQISTSKLFYLTYLYYFKKDMFKKYIKGLLRLKTKVIHV